MLFRKAVVLNKPHFINKYCNYTISRCNYSCADPVTGQWPMQK